MTVIFSLLGKHSKLDFLVYSSTAAPLCLSGAQRDKVIVAIQANTNNKEEVQSVDYDSKQWSGDSTKGQQGVRCGSNSAVTQVSCDASEFWCM